MTDFKKKMIFDVFSSQYTDWYDFLYSNKRGGKEGMAYRDMYDALGIKNINTILPPPEKPSPMDPAMENMQSMAGKPF